MRSNHLTALVLLFAVTGPLMAEDPPEPDDTTKMNGVWVADKVIFAGRRVASKRFPFELHFEKSRLTFKFTGRKNGKDIVYEIDTDSSKTPSTIDITRKVREKTVAVRGIYKFEDSRLVMCSLRGPDRWPSSERPETFESSRSITSELLILKRKPAADSEGEQKVPQRDRRN